MVCSQDISGIIHTYDIMLYGFYDCLNEICEIHTIIFQPFFVWAFKFLPGSGCVDTAIWMHHMDAYEAAGEEAGRKLHKNVESSIKQVLATAPHETPTIRTLAPHHENYTSSTKQTRRTLLEKQGRAHKRCTPVDPHIWMCKSGTTSTNIHTAAMWGHRM